MFTVYPSIVHCLSSTVYCFQALSIVKSILKRLTARSA